MTEGTPSPRVLALLKSASAIRERQSMVDDEQLELLLMDQDLEPSEALVDFEHRHGGWVGSWLRLGVGAMSRYAMRLPGYALVGRRTPEPIFMRPDGCVVLVDEGRARLEAASMDVWLEREALCVPLRKKENALVVHAWGADVAAMVAAMKATRDEPASDALSTTWVVPKGRGVLVEHDHGELIATFPSVRAASRCFDDPDVALRLRPFRPKLERAEPAERSIETAVSFRPVERGGLIRRAGKAVVGEDPVLHQWTERDGTLRSHAFLRDGGSKLAVYVAAGLPQPLSSVDGARDSALTLSRDDLDALVFARGLPSLDAAFAFDRDYGGVAFWVDGRRALLGAAGLLLTDPGLTSTDISGHDRVPIAFARDRLWAIDADGTITLVADEGDPHPAPSPNRFVDAAAFLRWLAADATEWRGFPYPVEA